MGHASTSTSASEGELPTMTECIVALAKVRLHAILFVRATVSLVFHLSGTT